MIASDINNLPNRFFQPALSTQAEGSSSGYFNDHLGFVVTDIADIDQCVVVILTTPKGSDPLRPLFGCDNDRYLDYPINSARPHIVRESVNALRAWEPRIDVVRVLVLMTDTEALACNVEWVFAGDQASDVYLTHLTLRSYQ